jgi:large subunit ribosomal protein L18
VQKSLRHVYAQLIDDRQGKSLVMISSVNFPFEQGGEKPRTKLEESARIGAALAARAKEKGITEVVFDRNHNLYHGRIKAVAEAARKEGLKF